MNIDFKLIKEKYPNGYEKLNDWFNIYDFDIQNKLNCSCGERSFICYCDLEKFFDDNRIIIEIFRDTICEYWHAIINSKCMRGVNGKTRQEAKEQAIIKSFEILEEQLNEK